MQSLFLLGCVASGSVDVTPVPVYDARSHITTISTHPNGVLQMVKAPDTQDMAVLHLHGTAMERGVAYGSLMAENIASFMNKIVNDYVVSLVQSITPEGLPDWLANALNS